MPMLEILRLTPLRRKPGLINMKYQAITFGPRYSQKDARFMDRFAEMMNLSDGTRSVAQIARIVGYEVGPIDAALVAEMFGDLEEFGFVELRNA
jgi:hypothetical protein